MAISSRLLDPVLIALSVLVLTGPPAKAAEAGAAAKEEAEKAAQAFQSLFGDELKRVAATRDVVDDLALAAKLLEAARAAEAQPALLTVLGEKCFDLAAQDPKGCETALAAAELLARKVPERAEAMQERILSVGQRGLDRLADQAAGRTAAGGGQPAPARGQPQGQSRQP